MIKCCMFDLDGTLLNTLSTITHYVNITLQKYGILPISEDECKYFVGNGARKLIERVLNARGREDLFSSVYSDYLAAYDTDPYYLTAPYPGIVQLITELKSRGIFLAVISNKQDSATRAAIAHFFPDCFTLVRGGVDGVPLKPDPTCTRLMLAELCVAENETAYIGDTGVDMQTGKNLGAALTVGVLWGFRPLEELEGAGADVCADEPMKILEFINK